METKLVTSIVIEHIKDTANHMSINIERVLPNILNNDDIDADDLSRIVLRALLLKELDRCDSGLNSEMRTIAYELYSEL